jgi:hypothetical protein
VTGDRAAWAEGAETHRVIKGRRWRVSDPRIPEPLRQALVDELMAARRAVGAAASAEDEQAARDRVHDAKVAIGKRGVRWWEAEADAEGSADRVRRAARALDRSPRATDGPLAERVAAVTSVAVDEVAAVLGT